MLVKIMRLFFIIFFSTILTLNAFPSGYWGSYMIKGTAKTKEKVLKNIEIKVKIGKIEKYLYTDSVGQFEVIVPWSTFHPPGKYIDHNPKYIEFFYNDKKVRIKNYWKLSLRVLKNKKVPSKVKTIEYKQGEEPCMFCDKSSFDYPNIYLTKRLIFN